MHEITPLPAPVPCEVVVQERPVIQKPPKKAKQLILIDPGHGGEDFGAHSNTKPYYQEKNLTLATSKLLKGYLEQLGYATSMTRTDDLFVALDKRAQMANQLKPALFVSVHYNSAPSKEAEGIEIYFFRDKENPSRTQVSRQCAQAILTRMIDSCNAKSRGIKHGNYLVIRETTVPAVLVEGGFLTHSDEMTRIKNPAYMKKLAWSIAQGIQDHLKKTSVNELDF